MHKVKKKKLENQLIDRCKQQLSQYHARYKLQTTFGKSPETIQPNLAGNAKPRTRSCSPQKQFSITQSIHTSEQDLQQFKVSAKSSQISFMKEKIKSEMLSTSQKIKFLDHTAIANDTNNTESRKGTTINSNNHHTSYNMKFNLSCITKSPEPLLESGRMSQLDKLSVQKTVQECTQEQSTAVQQSQFINDLQIQQQLDDQIKSKQYMKSKFRGKFLTEVDEKESQANPQYYFQSDVRYQKCPFENQKIVMKQLYNQAIYLPGFDRNLLLVNHVNNKLNDNSKQNMLYSQFSKMPITQQQLIQRKCRVSEQQNQRNQALRQIHLYQQCNSFVKKLKGRKGSDFQQQYDIEDAKYMQNKVLLEKVPFNWRFKSGGQNKLQKVLKTQNIQQCRPRSLLNEERIAIKNIDIFNLSQNLLKEYNKSENNIQNKEAFYTSSQDKTCTDETIQNLTSIYPDLLSQF